MTKKKSDSPQGDERNKMGPDFALYRVIRLVYICYSFHSPPTPFQTLTEVTA